MAKYLEADLGKIGIFSWMEFGIRGWSWADLLHSFRLPMYLAALPGTIGALLGRCGKTCVSSTRITELTLQGARHLTDRADEATTKEE